VSAVVESRWSIRLDAEGFCSCLERGRSAERCGPKEIPIANHSRGLNAGVLGRAVIRPPIVQLPNAGVSTETNSQEDATWH